MNLFYTLSNDAIEKEISAKYGRYQEESEPIKFTAKNLRDMIENNASGELSPLEMSYQAQIFADFLKYKNYADQLYALNNATKYDTSKLRSGSNVRLMQALLRRVEESKFFDSSSLERMISSSKEVPNLTAALKDTFNQSPKFFEDLDVKEFDSIIGKKMDELAYNLTNPELRKTGDDVAEHLQKFDSFISSYIVQNSISTRERGRLTDMIRPLFQGENSLPARVLQAKNNPILKENLLIQEFYPMLQGVVDPSHPEFDIDNLRLFSKKLATVDVDLLSDSFLELKELDSKLAEDILIFSLLQSGFDFSPIAFFQVLPSTEVISLLKPYFSKFAAYGLDENIDSVYENFVQNNYHNSAVVPSVRVYSNKTTMEGFAKGQMKLASLEQYVTVSMPAGEKTIGGITKQEYITKLFKLQDEAKDGKGIYNEIPLKGKKQFLVNAGAAIRKENTEKIITPPVKRSKTKGRKLGFTNTPESEIQDEINKKECK